MRILALEPFYGGSHRQFLDGYRRHSRHEIEVAGMPARKWKWRMRGAALHYAEQYSGRWDRYDLLFASDFLSLADLVALAPDALARVPKAVYFHENQLTYPCREESERDYQFAFTNITTCLVADRVFFNSEFHRQEFLGAVGPFLRRMPDHRPPGVADTIERKSAVLHFGIDLDEIRAVPRPERSGPPLILWNHRWEFDKDPESFFETLIELKREGVDFRVAVAGERFPQSPNVFERARRELADRIEHFGFLPSRGEYLKLLRRCDIVCSTAIHEFFGVSVVEAVAAGCRPILPSRLSYPELLPTEHHGDCLYAPDERFKAALRDAILRIDTIREQDPSRMVERFGWATLGEAYDRALAGMG